MDKVIRYRLYPDDQQLNTINQTIGCCRFVYNQALSWKKLAYEADGTHLTYSDCAFGLTRIKKLYPWLCEADSAALQQSLRHLEEAFKRFFTVKGTGYPKFKSKHKSRKSYTTVQTNGNIAVLSEAIKLPKAGTVKASIHRVPGEDWKLTSCTVSVEGDGNVFCSCHFTTPEEVPVKNINSSNVIGLDYKSDGLYMDSEGHVCGTPRAYRTEQDTLAKKQCRLKNKTVGSANYNKQQQRIAKVHTKIKNRRIDFLHKESLRIANSYDVVCVESLNMRKMSNKTFGNGKATMDNGYGKFLDLLEYKLKRQGKVLVRVDKWYPSSQICHVCGTKNPEIKDLRIRRWKCSSCGSTHNRDLNAALNIKNEGLRMLNAV